MDRTGDCAIKTRSLSEQDILEIRNGKIAFVIAIKIEYTDAVGSYGVTTINALYEPNEGNWVFAPVGNSVRQTERQQQSCLGRSARLPEKTGGLPAFKAKPAKPPSESHGRVEARTWRRALPCPKS